MLRKMLNFARIASIVALLLLLTGCDGITAKANDPLSEEEVIEYVCDKIREECGDEVTATIVSKTQLEIPTAWFDGPMGYIDVEGGHSYVLEVKNKEIEELVANAYYDDGYTEYSSKKTAGGAPIDTPGAGNGVSATPTEAIDPSSFDYIVFWYDSEPNSSHNGDTQIFGVK